MNVIELETVDSTNTYGKNHLDMISDKSVVCAKRQLSGRGRMNRDWVDLGEGNLFMSFILKPDNKFRQNFPNLTQYLSVCLCKILETYGVVPQIKWPNDVLINGKKLAGILAETVAGSDGTIKGIILGVGVNLNAQQSDLSQITDKIAVSLNLETGCDIDLNEFRDKLVNKFFESYEEFLETGFDFINDYYVEKSFFIGKEINVQVFDKIKKGVAKSVNKRGELVLSDENKELILNIGDII